MCVKFMAMDYMIGEGVEDELEFYSSLDLHLFILIMGHSRYAHRLKLEVVIGMIIVWIKKHMEVVRNR